MGESQRVPSPCPSGSRDVMRTYRDTFHAPSLTAYTTLVLRPLGHWPEHDHVTIVWRSLDQRLTTRVDL